MLSALLSEFQRVVSWWTRFVDAACKRGARARSRRTSCGSVLAGCARHIRRAELKASCGTCLIRHSPISIGSLCPVVVSIRAKRRLLILEPGQLDPARQLSGKHSVPVVLPLGFPTARSLQRICYGELHDPRKTTPPLNNRIGRMKTCSHSDHTGFQVSDCEKCCPLVPRTFEHAAVVLLKMTTGPISYETNP